VFTRRRRSLFVVGVTHQSHLRDRFVPQPA
jgi:hypothetical protein